MPPPAHSKEAALAETPIRIAIAGARGRMGQALAAAAEGRSDIVVAARFDRADGPQDGLQPIRDALVAADVVVDFTTAEASTELAAQCAAAGVPAMVIGSTGLSPEQIAVIDDATRHMAVVRSGNYSLGVNLLAGLVVQAARALPGTDWDIEVFEAHHKRKIDAPSGTALMLGEAAAKGRGVALSDVARRVGEGITGARPQGAIEFSVMRAGGIVGDHSVTFAAEDEILTLSHSARDRSLFARGALAAARWVAGRPAGLYDMQDVLGMKGG